MQINKCFFCMEEMALEEETCPHCGKRRGEIPQPEYALLPGTILRGKYLIGAILGQGGFGITYIGYDLLLKIKVAIKEYYPSCAAGRSRLGNVLWSTKEISKEEGCNNFLKEARKMAKLMDIPEVVRVLDILQENDTAYIVMDFVEGITLKEKLKRDGRMSVGEVVTLLGPIADALDKVHKHEIIHRDISPDNVIIDPDGEAKLLDLGAAKELDMRSNRDKQSSQLIHKDGFSPPEQYITGGNIGPWTDVYAMSATVYYCITGKIIASAMDRVYSEALGSDADQKAGISFPDSFSQALRNVLEKGLSTKTAKRYQTMKEFWDALREAAGCSQKLTGYSEKKAGKWTCSKCGSLCSGNFCENCGSAKPDKSEENTSADGSENAEAEETNISVGNIVIFGNYEQDNDESDGKEEIEWIVLDVEDGKALLISRYILAHGVRPVNWLQHTRGFSRERFP